MTPDELQIQRLNEENLRLRKEKGQLEAEAEAARAVRSVMASSRSGPVSTHAPAVQVLGNIRDELRGYAKLKPTEALARGRFFETNIAPIIARMRPGEFSVALSESLRELDGNAEVMASNSLGTLSGSLVAQQSLSYLRQELPLIDRITTDFSNASAVLNQTVYTRIPGSVQVRTYDPAVGFVVSDAGSTDVPITITQHVYAHIAYNANELGATNRDLFREQSISVTYAVAKYISDALYALINPTNFALAAQTTVQALNGFDRKTVKTMGKKMTIRGVSKDGRTLLLNPDYYQQLGEDPALLAFDEFHDGGMIQDDRIPRVARFDPFEAPTLPTANNLVGFGMTKESLCIAARIPSDYSSALPGASYGNVTQITDPQTGLTLLLVQYVDHNMGKSNYRVSAMFGVGTGNTATGQLLTSA